MIERRLNLGFRSRRHVSFVSRDRAMLLIHDRFEFDGRGLVSVPDDVGGRGDLLLIMVRHDLQSESRGASGHGREFDEVGDQAPSATTAG